LNREPNIQNNLHKTYNKLYFGLLLAGVYIIAPFLLAAMHNQPAADDYFTAVRDAGTGFIPVLQDSYLHWSGRYFALVIARINPLVFHSFTAYKLYAVILLLLFAASLFVLLRQLLNRYLTLKQLAALTVLIAFVYFAAMPSVSEGFYWFSGAWVYQGANVLCMFFVTILLKLLRTTTKLSRLFYATIATIMAVCIVGCNEISLIIICCCLTVFTIQNYLRRCVAFRYFLAIAIITFIAAAISAFAPGNFERLNHQQEYSVSWIWTFSGGLSITGVYTLQWLVQIFIASLLYIPLWGNTIAQKMAANNVWINVKVKWVVVFFVATFAFVQLFTVWAAGGSNAGRIENVIYLFFLLGYFFILQVILVQRAKKNEESANSTSPLLLKIAVILFFINVLDINNNISAAWIDVLSGKEKKYDTELTERAVTAKQCLKDTCLVTPLSALPKTIFFEDIKCTSDSVDLWVNKAYSAYFGKGYIVTSAPLPPEQSNMETLKNLGREIRENMFK